MKKELLFIFICCILLITGCSNKNNSDNLNSSKLNINNEQNDIKENVNVSDIKVTINDKTYILKLDNNKTVNEFIELLPQEFTMNELNGNEKYVYMNHSLSTNPYNPNHIEKGDVMLYGDNCFVIFYQSFDTNYRYTKIGHIDNMDDLGNGNISVKIEP